MARATSELPDHTLDQLRQMMRANNVTQLLVKELAANDNAKNQPYMGGSMDIANILPMGNVRVEITDDGNKSLKAPLPLDWLQPDGSVAPAPGAQLILYPQYPEVRLSGFLRGAANAPNKLMNVRQEGRLLFLGITNDRRIVGWAAGPESRIAREYNALRSLERIGVFFIIPLGAKKVATSARDQLVAELRRIHLLGWIGSKALRTDGTLAPCISSNCVGYTLEAEFNVSRNGRAEPDYLGWEIKAGLVSRFGGLPTAKAVTLMTPEPTGGYYRIKGVEAFVRKFGYPDKMGRADRLNFGGVFRAGERHAGTKLTINLDGFDSAKGRIIDPAGSLALVSDKDEIAAEWSFAALMTLWNRKHAQAVYVPAETRDVPRLQYRYGSTVRLGEGTDITKLLQAIAAGRVYYDPAIKLEKASTKRPALKRRSQFRVQSKDIAVLYARMESVNVLV